MNLKRNQRNQILHQLRLLYFPQREKRPKLREIKEAIEPTTNQTARRDANPAITIQSKTRTILVKIAGTYIQTRHQIGGKSRKLNGKLVKRRAEKIILCLF